jgi:hypothetical protein
MMFAPFGPIVPFVTANPPPSATDEDPISEGYQEIKIKKKFEQAMRATFLGLDPDFLFLGPVDTVEVEGSSFLVSVGVAPSDPGQANNPRSRMNWIKVAQSNAKKNVMNFTHGVVETEEYIDRTTETEVIRSDLGTQKKKRVAKVVTTWTSETAAGHLRGAIPVGTWYSNDRRTLYYAIAIPLR